jgi:hypothetical protein
VQRIRDIADLNHLRHVTSMRACEVYATSESRHPAVELRSRPPTGEELATPYLVVIRALALLASRAVAQTRGPKINVDPLVREGFADIVTGIRHSIRDIRHEVRAAVLSAVNATAHAAALLKA